MNKIARNGTRPSSFWLLRNLGLLSPNVSGHLQVQDFLTVESGTDTLSRIVISKPTFRMAKIRDEPRREPQISQRLRGARFGDPRSGLVMKQLSLPFQSKALLCSETSETTHETTQLHSATYLNLWSVNGEFMPGAKIQASSLYS